MKTDQSCGSAKTGPANHHQGARLPLIGCREHPCNRFRAHLPHYGYTSPETVYIVRQVPQPDFDLSMNRTDCSQNKVPGHLSLNTEHMFDPAPYPRSRPVTPFIPNPGGVENESGSRIADGSSCKIRHDCISRRASKAVGLSAALTVDKTVRGRSFAKKDLGRPPVLSWLNLMMLFWNPRNEQLV